MNSFTRVANLCVVAAAKLTVSCVAVAVWLVAAAKLTVVCVVAAAKAETRGTGHAFAGRFAPLWSTRQSARLQLRF